MGAAHFQPSTKQTEPWPNNEHTAVKFSWFTRALRLFVLEYKGLKNIREAETKVESAVAEVANVTSANDTNRLQIDWICDFLSLSEKPGALTTWYHEFPFLHEDGVTYNTPFYANV